MCCQTSEKVGLGRYRQDTTLVPRRLYLTVHVVLTMSSMRKEGKVPSYWRQFYSSEARQVKQSRHKCANIHMAEIRGVLGRVKFCLIIIALYF